MKKCFCLLLACLLCLSVPGAFAEGAGDPLAEAFDGSAAIVLEEETWPGLPDEEALWDTALGFIDLSPDGKYALVYARFTGGPDGTGDRLYLLRLDTMEARPVEVPDGKLGLKLAAGSSFGRRYEPRIVWHPDGTVVMLTEDDGIGFFTLAVR